MSLARRHELLTFVVLAYAISWIVWVPLVLRAQGSNVPTIPYQHYLGAVGPIGAALIVASALAGRAGAIQLIRGLAVWRVGLHWYLIAIFGPAALYAISVVGIGLYSGEWTDLGAFGQSEEFPMLGLASVFVVHTMTFGVGEEVGWRGFALPRLQARHSAFTSTILLSVIWALWHVPTFFYRPGYSSMGPSDIVGWFLSILTGAVLLTWLFNSTRGSILIVALFHGSVDVAFTSRSVDTSVMTTMGVLIVFWAMAVVAITRPANLAFASRQVLAASNSLAPRPGRAPERE